MSSWWKNCFASSKAKEEPPPPEDESPQPAVALNGHAARPEDHASSRHSPADVAKALQCPSSWEARVMGGIPISLAVLSNDARDVLWSVCGSEEVAKQQLKKALKSMRVSKACGDAQPSTLLAALLGPELEQQVLQRTKEGRSWRGTVTIEDGEPDSNRTTPPLTPGSGHIPEPLALERSTSKQLSFEFSASPSPQAACTVKPVLLTDKEQPQAVSTNGKEGAEGVKGRVTDDGHDGIHVSLTNGLAEGQWHPSPSLPSAFSAPALPTQPMVKLREERQGNGLAVLEDDAALMTLESIGHGSMVLPSVPEMDDFSSCLGTSRRKSDLDAPQPRRKSTLSSIDLDGVTECSSDSKMERKRSVRFGGGKSVTEGEAWMSQVGRRSSKGSRRVSIEMPAQQGSAPGSHRSSLAGGELKWSASQNPLFTGEEMPEDADEDRHIGHKQPSRRRACRSKSAASDGKFSKRSSLLMSQDALDQLSISNNNSRESSKVAALLKSISQASDHLPCADELGRPSLRAGVISRRAHRSSTSTIIGHFGHVEISEESATDGPQRLPSLKYPPSRRSRSVEFVSRQSAMNADAQARQLMMRASQGDQGSGNSPQSYVDLPRPGRAASDGLHGLIAHLSSESCQTSHSLRPSNSTRSKRRSSMMSIGEGGEYSTLDGTSELSAKPSMFRPLSSPQVPKLELLPQEGEPSHELENEDSVPAPAAALQPRDSLELAAVDSGDDCMVLSFDAMVSLLEPGEGSRSILPCPDTHRSPLLVLIFNSTAHTQARSTLTKLAESQLELLSSIMPQHAIQFLATESTQAVPKNVGQLAREHKNVTLMFMDIQGFTTMSKSVRPEEVLVFLNTLFSLFDKLTDDHGVHKVETAGDCYIVGGGIMEPQQSKEGFGLVVAENADPADSAKRVLEFSKDILEVAQEVMLPRTNDPVRIRVGLHTGDVVSGLIGSKLPKLGIFGDPMNTASRMESTGVPGRIHVSEATYKLLPDEQWEPTGGVEVKGKGRMNTYFWKAPAEPSIGLTRSTSLRKETKNSPFEMTSMAASPFLAHTRNLVRHAQK